MRYTPNSGMAVDCLGAAIDLGRQYGQTSPGYQLARYGPLDRPYEVIWGNISDKELDYVETEAAFVRLIDLIGSLA